MQWKVWQDQSTWDVFLSTHAPRSGAVLHAWGWGTGERVGAVEDGRLVGIARVRTVTLPFGLKYGIVERGPVADASVSASDALAVSLAECLRASGLLFLRAEPLVEHTELGLATPDRSPARTLITDLTIPAAERQQAMHPKTRYNIRLAQKKGVSVRMLAASDFDLVWPLFVETARRDGFRLHSKARYERMLENKTSAAHISLVAAFWNHEPLAANIVDDYLGTRTYAHGASSSSHRELMAPYALHAWLIEDAAAKGLKAYDWWGIAKTDDPADPWAGITRFKRGFGGEIVQYAGTRDFVVGSPWLYQSYRILRSAGRFALTCSRKLRTLAATWSRSSAG